MPSATKFLEKTQPVNILDVVACDVLTRLLDSYCFPLLTSLIVYYPKKLPATNGNLAVIESQKVRTFFLGICQEYRESNDMCEQACRRCDGGIVLKYYRGEWKGPRLYRCHLGLWDMTYPLYAGDFLLGTLWGGQIIVGEQIPDWSEALEEVKDEVEWDPFCEKGTVELPRTSNQAKDVCAAIDAKDEIKDDRKRYLKSIVVKETSKDSNKYTLVPDLIERYKKFKEFGKTLDRVLEDLYIAQINTARGQHIHESSKIISETGARIIHEPEQFWNTLDRVVRNTLPDAKGYVFYKFDQHDTSFKPVRTCIYDNRLFPNDVSFRNLCKHVFKELKSAGERKNFVLYDLANRGRLVKYHNLFQEAIRAGKQVLGGASVVAVPLIKGDKGLTGALVCACARQRKIAPGESGISESFLKFYAEVLMDIADVLSMVFARHDAEDAQATAWAVRSHELVAPIHAVKGYQDNLKYVFRRYVEPLLRGGDTELKAIFEARLSRLEALCNLQELIATSVSLGEGKKPEDFRRVNLRNEILVPIVQPLRDYGENEKSVPVYFDEAFSVMGELYLLVNETKRCLFNLVFNAIKYSDDYASIYIEFKETEHNYEIHVKNKGIGVPEGEEEQIFLTFKQGSNAGAKAAYGAGLGLTVARKIARLHGGDVTLLSGDPKNTVFGLILPRSLHDGPPGGSGRES